MEYYGTFFENKDLKAKPNLDTVFPRIDFLI